MSAPLLNSKKQEATIKAGIECRVADRELTVLWFDIIWHGNPCEVCVLYSPAVVVAVQDSLSVSLH